MSSHPADFSYPNYPAPVHPHNARDDDVKAPYDDLIDQYGSPYGAQPHKTFAVDPSALSSHARQPSYTVSNQSHETSKDLKSAYSQDPPDWEYPPPLAKEEKLSVEKKTAWSKVRLSSHVAIVLSLNQPRPQYVPDSWACRLYLLTVLVETAIDLAIEGDIILRFHESDSSDSEDMATRRMPVYLSIFALAQ